MGPTATNLTLQSATCAIRSSLPGTAGRLMGPQPTTGPLSFLLLANGGRRRTEMGHSQYDSVIPDMSQSPFWMETTPHVRTWMVMISVPQPTIADTDDQRVSLMRPLPPDESVLYCRPSLTFDALTCREGQNFKPLRVSASQAYDPRYISGGCRRFRSCRSLHPLPQNLR